MGGNHTLELVGMFAMVPEFFGQKTPCQKWADWLDCFLSNEKYFWLKKHTMPALQKFTTQQIA
jgi:hypothetical protein